MPKIGPAHSYAGICHSVQQQVNPPSPLLVSPRLGHFLSQEKAGHGCAQPESTKLSPHLVVRSRDDNRCGAVHELVIGFVSRVLFDPSFHFEELSVSPYI